ncbi:hypothetical protein ACHWQZ_G006989 [Mnemiopsis leidyi]
MAIKSVVPMVVPIAIGCVPLATIGSIIMEPLDGNAPFTLTTQSEWIISNSNSTNYGKNGANGESLVIMATVATFVPQTPLVTMAIGLDPLVPIAPLTKLYD